MHRHDSNLAPFHFHSIRFLPPTYTIFWLVSISIRYYHFLFGIMKIYWKLIICKLNQNCPLYPGTVHFLSKDRPLFVKRPSTVTQDRPLSDGPSTFSLVVHFPPFGPSTFPPTPFSFETLKNSSNLHKTGSVDSPWRLLYTLSADSQKWLILVLLATNPCRKIEFKVSLSILGPIYYYVMAHIIT